MKQQTNPSRPSMTNNKCCPGSALKIYFFDDGMHLVQCGNANCLRPGTGEHQNLLKAIELFNENFEPKQEQASHE